MVLFLKKFPFENERNTFGRARKRLCFLSFDENLEIVISDAMRFDDTLKQIFLEMDYQSSTLVS